MSGISRTQRSTPMDTITEAIAIKVRDTVDLGLVKGKGSGKPGDICVEAAVCYAMGLPHSDDPPCVSRALRQLKIVLNDASWSSNEALTKGMRRLAILQLGTRDTLDDIKFSKRVTTATIRTIIPLALRAAASIHTQMENKEDLERAALNCEINPAADAAAAAADAAADAVVAAARAAARAARTAARAARAAARAAVDAAAADEVLIAFAKLVENILIDMNAAGAQWLYLLD